MEHHPTSVLRERDMIGDVMSPSYDVPSVGSVGFEPIATQPFLHLLYVKALHGSTLVLPTHFSGKPFLDYYLEDGIGLNRVSVTTPSGPSRSYPGPSQWLLPVWLYFSDCNGDFALKVVLSLSVILNIFLFLYLTFFRRCSSRPKFPNHLTAQNEQRKKNVSPYTDSEPSLSAMVELAEID